MPQPHEPVAYKWHFNGLANRMTPVPLRLDTLGDWVSRGPCVNLYHDVLIVTLANGQTVWVRAK